MTDRVLLEQAAKAAGLKTRWYIGSLVLVDSDGLDAGWWNPLKDDGDALRLAVQLKLGVFVCNGVVVVEASMDENDACDALGADPCATTRRAIVRAAAEIGRAMP